MHKTVRVIILGVIAFVPAATPSFADETLLRFECDSWTYRMGKTETLPQATVWIAPNARGKMMVKMGEKREQLLYRYDYNEGGATQVSWRESASFFFTIDEDHQHATLVHTPSQSVTHCLDVLNK